MPIRVTGVGAALPKTAVSNDELAATLDTSIPATAPLVARELGLQGIPAFDVNAVCTGFLYALTTTHALLSAQHSNTALVIGSDVFSSILNPHDRSTRSIFGDSAGAVVIERSTIDSISSRLGADGAGYDLITRPSSGSAYLRNHSSDLAPYFTLVGASVFFHAITRMTEACRELLAETDMTTALRRPRLRLHELDAPWYSRDLRQHTRHPLRESSSHRRRRRASRHRMPPAPIALHRSPEHSSQQLSKEDHARQRVARGRQARGHRCR